MKNTFCESSVPVGQMWQQDLRSVEQRLSEPYRYERARRRDLKEREEIVNLLRRHSGDAFDVEIVDYH